MPLRPPRGSSVFLLVLAALVTALLATGCRRRRVAAKEPVEVREGRALYLKYCALCHGKNAEGYAADHANALGNQAFLEIASPAFLRAAILEGRPGTPMSAWGKEHGGPLGPVEVDRLVAYLRSLAKKPLRAIDPAQRVGGDPIVGGVTYQRSCRICHGGSGEGTTRATSLTNPAFLRTVGDEYLRKTIVEGRPGTSMPPFSALQPPAVADVIAYLRVLGTPPPPPVPAPVYEPPPGLERLVLNPKGAPPAFTLREGRYVPAAQVAKALEDKRRIILLDARPTSDWHRGHIVGALPFPFYDIEEMVKHIPRDGTFVVAYCACPHAASGHVVDELRKRKFPNTAVLDEGIGFWTSKGYPTAQSPLLTAPAPSPALQPPLQPPPPAAPKP